MVYFQTKNPNLVNCSGFGSMHHEKSGNPTTDPYIETKTFRQNLRDHFRQIESPIYNDSWSRLKAKQLKQLNKINKTFATRVLERTHISLTPFIKDFKKLNSIFGLAIKKPNLSALSPNLCLCKWLQFCKKMHQVD
jgi:hypothetical protein